IAYFFKFFVPYVFEFFKFLQRFNYIPQGFKNILPHLIRFFYLYKKKLVALLFHLYQVCSGSNIILSIPSIFFSISFIVLFHIASSASSSFLSPFISPSVALISFTLLFIISKTSKISLYSSTFTKTGMPLFSPFIFTHPYPRIKFYQQK